MPTWIKSVSIIGLTVGALALGGCATREEVEHAQATADQAVSQAQAANAAAQHAQSAADAAAGAAQRAQTSVDGLGSDVQKIDTRLVSVEGDVDHLTHHHEHGTWENVGVKHGKLHRMPKHKQASAAPSSTAN
jgi:GAF domain-containing protein